MDPRNGMTKCNVQLKRITETRIRNNNEVRREKRNIPIRHYAIFSQLQDEAPYTKSHVFRRVYVYILTKR